MSFCKITLKYDWVFSLRDILLSVVYFTHNIHIFVCRFLRTPPCTRYIVCLDPSSGAFFKRVLGHWIKS